MVDLIKFDFVNREDELNSITNPAGSPYIVIDAPAGYGKSCLLRKARDYYEKEGRDKWQIVWVDLSSNEYKNEKSIIKSISSALFETEAESISDLNQKIKNENQNPIILFVDACEQKPELTKYLQKEIIPVMEEHITSVKVFFAGRSVKKIEDSKWSSYEMKILKPFEEMFIRDLLPKRSKLDEIVRKIALLSGGHPGAVVCLIKKLNNNNWKLENDQELYDDCVRRYLEIIINEVPLELKEIIVPLHVFRKFNINIFNEIISNNEFPNIEIDSISLIGKLVQTGLIHRPTLENPFYFNTITRNLIIIGMKLEKPERYRKLNEVAYQLYEKLYERSIDDKNKEINPIFFIIEMFYHFLEKEDTILWNSILKKINDYFQHSDLVGSGEYPDLLLGDGLKEDKDIRFRLEELGYYSHFTDLVERSMKKE